MGLFILNTASYYAILPVILIIGSIVTYQDFKEGKIRNKWIKLGVVIGLLYFFILIILTVLGSFEYIDFAYYPPDYYLNVLLNTVIAFALGFAIWNFNLWAGGDAKLFALYVFLIPLSFYSVSYYWGFPGLNLLINIILPIFVYLIIKMLLYPLQLFFGYLKSPKLLREYWQKHKKDHQLDKNKFKEYLNTGLSFLLILIFFQLIRRRLGNYLEPYIGQLVTPAYFLLGFVVFKPLRTFLKKYLIAVVVAVLVYFIVGLVYFKTELLGDLAQVFALQIIFMMTYFYIFKFGRAIGTFLYNSAEVKVVPINNIGPGVFINKDYIKEIMGSRVDLDSLTKELEEKLPEDDWALLYALINRKANKEEQDKKQKEFLSIFRNLRLRGLPSIISKGFVYKWQKDADKALLDRVNKHLNEKQQNELDNVLKETNDVQKFLKTIKGRLTEDQANKLKEMLAQRNKEIVAQELAPVENIILHKTFSFAPFMLLGVIITLATKTSIIHLIYEYILHR